MAKLEYKVVPAPKKGAKSWGMKSSEDRFATALSKLMNELAAEGWEYQRSDTLPCEEKSGFRGKTTVFQNMLIFRREAVEVENTVKLAPHVEMPVLRAEPKPEARPEVRPVREEPKLTAATETAPAADVVLPVFMRGERDKKPELAAE